MFYYRRAERQLMMLIAPGEAAYLRSAPVYLMPLTLIADFD